MWEATRRGPERPELTPGVPPAGTVHLTDAGHDQAKLQQTLEVDQTGPDPLAGPEASAIHEWFRGLWAVNGGPRYSEWWPFGRLPAGLPADSGRRPRQTSRNCFAARFFR